MATHIALLRGINLGGRNRVAMAGLRTLVAGLGYTDVATYIQSGNVLFTAPDLDDSALSAALAGAVAAGTGMDVGVVVVSRDELAEVVSANPFPSEPDPKNLHAVLLSGPPGAELRERITTAASAPAATGSGDTIREAGRVLYLHTPGGFGRSDLSAKLMRLLSSPKAGVVGTARNWRTVNVLLNMFNG
jgi:uncharacterized protein (DUF1697 family)